MCQGLEKIENHCSKLLLYVDFKLIFKLSSHKNEKGKLDHLHNSWWPQNLKLSQSLWRNTAIPGINKERFWSCNCSYPKLTEFRLSKGGLQRGRRCFFHSFSFPKLENQEMLSNCATMQASLVGSDRNQLAIGQIKPKEM